MTTYIIEDASSSLSPSTVPQTSFTYDGSSATSFSDPLFVVSKPRRSKIKIFGIVGITIVILAILIGSGLLGRTLYEKSKKVPEVIPDLLAPPAQTTELFMTPTPHLPYKQEFYNNVDISMPAPGVRNTHPHYIARDCSDQRLHCVLLATVSAKLNDFFPPEKKQPMLEYVRSLLSFSSECRDEAVPVVKLFLHLHVLMVEMNFAREKKDSDLFSQAFTEVREALTDVKPTISSAIAKIQRNGKVDKPTKKLILDLQFLDKLVTETTMVSLNNIASTYAPAFPESPAGLMWKEQNEQILKHKMNYKKEFKKMNKRDSPSMILAKFYSFFANSYRVKTGNSSEDH